MPVPDLYPPPWKKTGDIEREKSWFNTKNIFGSGRSRGFILLGIAVVMAIVGVFVTDNNSEINELTGIVESVTEREITLQVDDALTLITLDDDILIKLQDDSLVDPTAITTGRELKIVRGLKQEDGSILAQEILALETEE